MAENKIIYMDNAATTRISDEVLEAMMPYLKENYGNASSFYDLGRKSRDAIEEARAKVAKSINAEPNEIFFTSGGSESDNWAIIGTLDAITKRRSYVPRIATTQIEHPAVMNTFKYVKSEYGIDTALLHVDRHGTLSINSLDEYVTEQEPDFLSVMMANNEVGTIQPFNSIMAVCSNKVRKHIFYHVDAVQAYGQIPIDVKTFNVDMLSASGHKVHAPKGVGFLYVRRGTLSLEPLIHGGHQERGWRAGTENVAGIVGLGEAANTITQEQNNNGGLVQKFITDIRDHMIDRILAEIPGCELNGDRYRRLPNNINVSFDGVSGEALAMCLASRGICVSSGSACATGSHEPSHVLKAMGRTAEEAHQALRITLSKYNTMSEANAVVGAIKEEVERLRSYMGKNR